MLTDIELWERAQAYHGHSCSGLAIGYKAAIYAKELLDITFSHDEEVVCAIENDACGLDALPVVLGCSVGKGNLLLRLRGKQAYSVFNRKTGKSVRLVFKGRDFGDITPEERKDALLGIPHNELFAVKKVEFDIPETAKLFQSIVCECCGEISAENYIRIQEGKKLCLECYEPYSRFI